MLRWNDRSDWIWSTDVTHEALVSSDDFEAVHAQMAAGAHRPNTTRRHRVQRSYTLSGLVTCGLCGRRMQGSWNHDARHYRCTFAANYAKVNGMDHPKAVYVRESAIVPKLDEWLFRLFDPENLDNTCEALSMVGPLDEGATGRQEAARRKIADCDSRLVKYRAALDADADPVVVSGWMREVQGERLAAEAELGRRSQASR